MVENVDEDKVATENKEQIEQNSAKISANEPSEVPIKTSDQENREQIGEQIDQNLAKISVNSAKISANKISEQKSFACDKCGKGFDTQKALSGHMTSHSKKKKEKEPLEQEKKKSIPYEEVESADVFLKNFLSEFDLKEQFVDLLCRRVKRRNALPYPSDLAADIQDMASGITNPKSANYIAEEYSYDLKEYEKRLKSVNKLRSSMGYAVDSSGSHDTGHDGSHHGISLDRYKGDDGSPSDFRRDREKEKEKSSVDPVKEVRKRYRARKAEHLEELMDVKEIADMERELDGGKEKQEEEVKRLREENRRLQEGDGHRNDPNSEMRERITKLEDDIRQRDADRMQRLEDDLKAARNTPLPQQNPGGLSREEAMQMISQNIDAQNKNLTRDDLERYVDRRMNDRSALTKGDLTYLEARDKLHLEEKKLDESGKTRDVIATSLRGGFAHVGKIVSRMMIGEGEAGGGAPVSGYSNREGNMVQMPCPKDLGGCGAVMTAPINSPKITCIGCGKIWDVLPPKTEEKPQIPPKTEEKPLVETSESTTDASGVTSEPTTDAAGVEKIAEGIAIGEATDKLEEEVKKKKELEELQQEKGPKGFHDVDEFYPTEKEEEELRKKELELEKKPWPTVDSNICPICSKKCKGKRGVGLHIVEMHPEYERRKTNE